MGIREDLERANAALDRADTDSNTVAAGLDEVEKDIRELVADIAGGVTPEEAAALATRAEAIADRVGGLATRSTEIGKIHDPSAPPE
jgi:hypothetical protein